MSIINRIAHDLNRAFAMFDEPFFTAARRFPTLPSSLINNTSFFRPSVDLAETDKSYVVEAEVPGVKKEDLSVEFLDDRTLILKGKVERGSGAGDREGLRTVDTTKTVGSFQRYFQFPGRVDPEKIKASYKDGILSVTVPKVAHESKKINIE
ncbi:3956_t:CDS:2 [Entrophospora sp. SA101]|nr:6067_t:CDS:2 [Entrophospora sp. SA101]CAJ0634269.1 1068_t:CDS:2 [Entrophospora sp. SA101]CAJ0757069.1 3956_t:CDS:2 [Entrophospora sp. SA101]CAJ0839164.1 13156_t:CDS:2 [Entrophospora sp. SA101]CAJ0856983.1 11588_t:CDS:2 [Entrophospora sp. SA101]